METIAAHRASTTENSQEPVVSPPTPANTAFPAEGAAELYTPFRDVASLEDDASSGDGEGSYAESHGGHRGWIAECLWWMAACRRPRYQSDYVVLFVNGSERFGTNSCRLSVMSEGSLSPLVLSDEVDTDDSTRESSRAASTWFRRTKTKLWASLRCTRRQPPRPASEYEVLIRDGDNLLGSNVLPLSDPRLKPRLPKLLIILLVLLSLGGILCVFFLVPRGVSLLDTTIDVNAFEINGSNQSVALVVSFGMPFKNPNYVSVDVTGQVNMTYYNATADTKNINVTLSRLDTTEERVLLDSSLLTLKYILTAIEHCYLFPRQEVFFITGQFKAKYLLQTQHLSVDTYKFIPCPIPQMANAVNASNTEV